MSSWNVQMIKMKVLWCIFRVWCVWNGSHLLQIPRSEKRGCLQIKWIEETLPHDFSDLFEPYSWWISQSGLSFLGSQKIRWCVYLQCCFCRKLEKKLLSCSLCPFSLLKLIASLIHNFIINLNPKQWIAYSNASLILCIQI